jgi:predicted small secreted protein
MIKTISRVVIALFAIALITASCGTRNGDKCPGVGQVVKTQDVKV